VQEIRQVTLLGFPARVARVQARHFSAWVVLELDELVLAPDVLQPGDRVQVFLAGAHVSERGVDWTKCISDDPAFCRYGSTLDDGPLSEDTGLPLSPSNRLIHFGSASSSWMAPLFWNTARPGDPDCTPPTGLPTLGDYNGNPDGWYRSERVTARLDGASYYRLDERPRAWTASGAVILRGEGSHRLTWLPACGESVTQFIRIDSQPPQIAWNANNPVELSGTVDLYGEASDPFSGVQEVQLSWDGGQSWETHPASVPGLEEAPRTFVWNFHWDTTAVPDGAYPLLARAIDRAGNQGEPVFWQVTVLNP
jgi:hypothetical protein